MVFCIRITAGIDMIATNPTASGNTVRTGSLTAVTSGKTDKKHGLRYIVKPIK